MTIYAQHGFRRSDTIEEGINRKIIDGVILSPRGEENAKLSNFARTLRRAYGGNITILFDPQFYVTTIQSASDGKLPEYPYYTPSLNKASFTTSNIQKYAKGVVDYQVSLGCLDRVISPSVMFNDFQDQWSLISQLLGQATIEYCQECKNEVPPLLYSLTLNENALKKRDSVDDFLDAVSTIDVKGFYLTIEQDDTSYPACIDEDALVNLMYLVHTLSKVNEFEVVFGYSDFIGIILQAVGAKNLSAGWFKSLKQFSVKSFQNSTGGRNARPRYTSKQLFNSILLNPELKALSDLGFLEKVLSGTNFDGILNPDPLANAENWQSGKTQCLHHWEVLKSLADCVGSENGTENKLKKTEELITSAITLYEKIQDEVTMVFEPSSGSRNLKIWQSAIKRFEIELKRG